MALVGKGYLKLFVSGLDWTVICDTSWAFFPLTGLSAKLHV